MRFVLSTGGFFGLRFARSRGFALIVTLMMMLLLALLAVGLLNLASVTLRSTGASSAQVDARANARLALALAIGDLQRHAGGDMKITAPADLIDAANPPLLGVWKSWEGSNHVDSGNLRGRPKAPDYGSKGDRFVSWLVSSGQENSSQIDAATLVSGTASPDTVPMVATGSLAEGDDREVHVTPHAVGDGGAYAWWISGENQKARLPEPPGTDGLTTADWADRNRNHQVADPEPFYLDAVLADPSLASRIPTLSTADIIAGEGAPEKPRQNFHDLSANSVGLLTNVATGGWRKDFSLLTENWDAQPTTGLEFYRISPTESLEYTRPADNTDYRPPNSMVYHWSDYRDSRLREFWARRGPIASWAKIKSYATLYKNMSAASVRAPNINHQSWVDNGTPENAHETFHNIRLLPQMARLQIIVSHYATSSGAEPGKFRPAVLYTPVVTVWNPYNTRLTLNGRYMFSPSYTWPLALNHRLSGPGAPSLADEYWAVQAGGTSDEYKLRRFGKSGSWFQDMVYTLAESPMILEPGETRVFSPSEGYVRDETNASRIRVSLSPGVRTGVGFFFAMDRRFDLNNPPDPANISFGGSVRMDVDARFDVPSRGTACGSAYQWFIDSFGSGRSHSWFQIFYEKEFADALYPPKIGLASATLAQCSETPIPFLSMILGSRIANHRATATKGVVQANPVVDFFSSGPRPRFTDRYPGMDNLLNCPWDFSVVEHSSGGDDMLPNVDNETSNSYIVTGVRKADGVSRMVAAELPTRPLASLADLTHMQVRGLNPTPPYAGNIVANSDAFPLIPRDEIVNASHNSRANARSNEQQDDSYCVNQVLFDDWFFSSIAPDPEGFGPDGGRSQRETYVDFLTGKEGLINRAYRPIRKDIASDEAAAEDAFAEQVEPADSWETIASRLEVEGMFNVNSTSAKAWRSLLGHARNQRIPYTRPDGSIALSDQTDYAFSRTSVVGDRAAGEAPQVSGEYADTTEFNGYRVFTDEMLDLLAEYIVEQVRLRGPFLSLSEFVNRQLSSDGDLALAGAIQAALNAVAANPGVNPFETMQNESVASEAVPFGNDPGHGVLPDTGYVFPEAAVGHNTYGLPGWTRQADVLRPLAPILSARDDTFTIRAYGESRAPDGSVLARAWCEATVRRTREFTDPADEADITTRPTSPINRVHGRRLEVISFRWLNPDEV